MELDLALPDAPATPTVTARGQAAAIFDGMAIEVWGVTDRATLAQTATA